MSTRSTKRRTRIPKPENEKRASQGEPPKDAPKTAEYIIGADVVTAAFDETDRGRSGIAEQIIQQALNNRSGCVSFQVVQETVNWLNKNQTLRPEDRDAYMENTLIPLWKRNPVWQTQPTLDTYLRALQIKDAYKLHFYAALLASGAIDAGCQTLYSKMYGSLQKIGDVDIVNPFN